MIYTVTFSPAIDYIVYMDELIPGETNRSTGEKYYYGGKGINVSTILSNLGIENVALGFVSGFTGAELESGLAANGLNTDFIHLKEGFTRINIKLKKKEDSAPSAMEETEINCQGAAVSPEAVEELMNRLDSLKEGDTLVVSGNIPNTMPDDMDRKAAPTEEDQFNAYKKVAETLGGRTVIIRTLDIGGDKDIPYMEQSREDNPFLGYRAVRYCLGDKELYKTQLRAILRASAFGKIWVMVPMVTNVYEMRQVRGIVERIKTKLDKEGIPYDKNIKVGAMIETPAASLISDILAKECDFFSIGTNDLIQYTMCADRGNADVAYLYKPYYPAVLRSLKTIIENGKKEGISVGMCGEGARDPMLIPLLLAFGLDDFSVTPTSVLSTRSCISKWTLEEAREVANKAMSLPTYMEVEEYLKGIIRK